MAKGVAIFDKGSYRRQADERRARRGSGSGSLFSGTQSSSERSWTWGGEVGCRAHGMQPILLRKTGVPNSSGSVPNQPYGHKSESRECEDDIP